MKRRGLLFLCGSNVGRVGGLDFSTRKDMTHGKFRGHYFLQTYLLPGLDFVVMNYMFDKDLRLVFDNFLLTK